MIIQDPECIENKSMEIIKNEIKRDIPDEFRDIVYRVIHTTADFDYADNLVFSKNAVSIAVDAFKRGCSVVTDTNMSKSGINRNALEKLHSKVYCFMSDEDVVQKAKQRGITRACVSMEKALSLKGPLIFAIGNAPTALLRLKELIDEKKIMPSLVIAVPVGFVNVIEAKEAIITCDVPYIVAKGRKGGSGVSAAIVNAIMYRILRCKEHT